MNTHTITTLCKYTYAIYIVMPKLVTKHTVLGITHIIMTKPVLYHDSNLIPLLFTNLESHNTLQHLIT